MSNPEMPEQVIDKSETTSVVTVCIHGQEVTIDASSPELMDLLGDSMGPGTPVALELQNDKAKIKSENDAQKILFLSDGTFAETGEFRCKKGQYGSTLALMDHGGSYSLVHRNSNVIMPAKVLQQNAVKKLTIGDGSFLPNFDAICALKFTEDAVYVNTSDYYPLDQEMTSDVTINFVTTMLANAIGNDPIKIHCHGDWNTVERDGVGIKSAWSGRRDNSGYMMEYGHMIEPTDYVVYEKHTGGKNLGYLKFDSRGNAFLLPRRSMRKLTKMAFSKDFVQQFYPMS